MDMPANRPIIIAFGMEIDPTTVVPGETFVVERIDEDEQVLGQVDGTVDISDMTLKFHPAEPWQEEELYRYTLKSSGWALCFRSTAGDYRIIANDATEIAPCSATILADHREFQCGVDAVCDNEGLPVSTMPLGTSSTRKSAPGSTYRKYEDDAFGPSLTAGGPNMSQFFRGAAPSPHVLQVLRTQPVADTNRNFISDRSNIGAANDIVNDYIQFFENIGGEPEGADVVAAGEFDFDIEEYGPEGSLMPGDPGYGLYPDLDPNGVKPAKNSAKVLSRFDSQGPAINFTNANIGCSYNATFSYTPPFIFESEILDPMECPENKFTYLMSAAIAEVTDEVDGNGRVKVNLWPSIVMGTSLDMYIHSNALGQFDYIAGVLSGPQIMRMRYAGVDGKEPITGWISEEQNQGPVLSMGMELYLDAPYAFDWDPIQNPGDLRSIPLEMDLEGAITFLDDGRMAVEQFNRNRIDIYTDIYGLGSNLDPVGYIDLFIPEYGSRINMISESIK
ncbi:hypothetical protein ASALC70_00598 [Alcanivorax sp. ALC70]|nr:hypothetical protein ASALC70_00598 [Alcanivorax sp. ALC70]